MIVDVTVWCWTMYGMRQGQFSTDLGYVEVREVERLLEEAHERGRRLGLEAAAQIIGNSYPP